MTSKLGFSVVAPMSMMVPSSTWGRKASCWARVKRWISSTKRMVRLRCSCLRSRAAATISRISLTPPSSGAEGDEDGAGAHGHEPGQRGLAGAGRAPEHQRGDLVGLDGPPQRPPGPEHVLLADEVLQPAGAQPLRQRLAGGIAFGGVIEEVHAGLGYHSRGWTGHPCPVPRRVGIVPKVTSAEATETAHFVAQFLRAKGVEVLTDEEAIGRDADLVVVLGGDGTLIHAAALLDGRAGAHPRHQHGQPRLHDRDAAERDVPDARQVLDGQGHGVAADEAAGAPAPRRLAGAGARHRGAQRRGHLQEPVQPHGRARRPLLAPYVSTLKADGVIVATPTGSTAYALAAIGPILYPTMRGVVLAPICPHTLTQRPLVVPDDETLDIVLMNDAEVFLTLDGKKGPALERGDRVQVKQSYNRVLLVQNPKLDFFGILRAKLRWGER